MSRRCIITGKGPLYGHNVSHSNRKTNRRYLPNLQRISLVSDALGHKVRLRLTTRAVRTIDSKGGLDAYLLSRPDAGLVAEALRLKRRIANAKATRAAAAAR